MSRFQRSLSLFKSSWSVIQTDRELLALPVISAVVSMMVAATFAAPTWLSMETETTVDSFGTVTESLSPTVLTFVLGALFYLCAAFVVIFFNAALILGANERFEGGDPTLSSALAGAWKRKGLILQWAAVSATVSMIIRQIQENGGVIGRILGGLLGFAWGVVTFLVLPIVVIEGVGVKDAFKRSTEAIRTTWGENLIGQGGLGLVTLLLLLPVIALGAAGVAALSATVALGVLLIAVAVVGAIVVATVSSALGVVYQTALYRFATVGSVDGFEQASLDSAFRQKS